MPIYTVKLLDRNTIANNTILLTLEKPDGFNYKAGQYCGFTLINPAETDEKGNNRRFSILSAPHDEHLMIVTRVQQSAYKRNLQTMALGSTLKVAGPIGNFILHDDAMVPAVFIAGGIGIAPFYSMIRDALQQRPEQKIMLFYGNQSLADTALLDELTALEQLSPQFKLITTLSTPHPEWKGEKGYITDEMLAKHIPDLANPIFYACGSPSMVAFMQQILRELSIDEERIKVEDFPGY
jgi:ferredoxin-NADP reductase